MDSKMTELLNVDLLKHTESSALSALDIIKKIIETMGNTIEHQKSVNKQLSEQFASEYQLRCEWEAESHTNYEEAHALSAYVEFLEKWAGVPQDTLEAWHDAHGLSEVMANHAKDRKAGV